MKSRVFKTSTFATLLQRSIAPAASILALCLCGCAAPLSRTTSSSQPISSNVSSTSISGVVHGGRQAIVGSSLYLFASTTNSYGNSSLSLLNTTAPGVSMDGNGNGFVLTDANGAFSINFDFVCLASNSQVYLAAIGGNAGSGANANSALLAALGNCGNLTPTTYVTLNELTTVAAVWALAPFLSGPTAIGASGQNFSGLQDAFAAAAELVNIGTGSAPGATLPTNATLPASELNTLADILAACINSSGGIAGSATPCGLLFTAATPAGGTAPTDTVTAALNIARNPGSNVTALYNVAPATGPFQPTLSAAPNDWTVAVKYSPGGLNAPHAILVDDSDNIWIANCGSANCATTGVGSVTKLSNDANTALTTSSGGINVPYALASDLSGNIWVANYGGNSLSELASTGAPVVSTAYTGGGLNQPNSIAVDNLGNVWLSNLANGSVSEFSNTGTSLSPAAGYTSQGPGTPVAIVINPM
jgi:hypothetical protein